MRRLILIALSTILTGASQASAQVTASFAVIPEQALPGIPVDFRLTLASASSEPVSLRNGALLEVTTDSGQTFFANSWDGEPLFPPIHRPEPWSDVVVVAAGTTRDYYWSPGCGVSQPFFYDPRMTKPGRYSLRVQISPEGIFDPASAQAVWSNPVTLTVRQPQGDDAAVWAMMLERAAKKGVDGFSGREWSAEAGPSEIAYEVYTKYPRSSYMPYVACFRMAHLIEDTIRHIETALALNPTGPIADRLRITIATWHHALADQARSALDAEGAIAHLITARQMLTEVSKQSAYPFVRNEALVFLNTLDTEEGIRKNVADITDDRRRSPFQQVIPFVDCVSIQHDGGLTARFGYRNIKDQTETIAEGSSNAVYPAGAAKNLPTAFRPGVRKNALRATSSGGAITWRLLTFQVTATKNSPPCKGNN